MRSSEENLEKLADGARRSLFKKKKFSSASRPQIELYDELKKSFPQAVLEAPLLDRMHVDILIDRVVIEYDGSGHNILNRAANADLKRDKALKKNGYAVIRVIAPQDNQPNMELLINSIKNIIPGSSEVILCDNL